LFGSNQHSRKEKGSGSEKKKIGSMHPSDPEPESQASDVTMADASQMETQTDGWEETQLIEDE
jgi:hypothetical protein